MTKIQVQTLFTQGQFLHCIFKVVDQYHLALHCPVTTHSSGVFCGGADISVKHLIFATINMQVNLVAGDDWVITYEAKLAQMD